jgi:selenide,water dikinase
MGAAPQIEAVPLTALAAGAGCGCKLPAAELLPLLSELPPVVDERLLVGADSCDDAAVVLVRPDLALVQSVDFFTPLVDDPYDFGRIAAANALSDVYAMGAAPLSALSLVAFPLARLGGEVLRSVLRGGLDVCAAAGALLAGGHSIDDAEPKYGLAVTGVADPARIVTNAGGRAGDVLVLSKPLGAGAVVTARRHGVRDDALLARAVELMTELNAGAAAGAVELGAHAMTDVTGFGLLGHLHHLCRESGLAAEVDAAAVPALDGALALLADEAVGVSGGSRRNAAWAERFARFGEGVPAARRRLACDATTSGGLLIALAPEAARRAAPAGAPSPLPGPIIGRLVDGPAGEIVVR